MAAAAIPIVGSLISGVLGGIFGNKQQTSTIDQTQTNNQNSTQAGTGQTTPTYADLEGSVKDQLLKYMLGNLFGNQTDLSGYATSGIANNNTALDAGMNNLNATLAARGLTNSPIAVSAIANLGAQRAQANAGVLQQLPLLNEQIRQQRLNQLNGFFTSLPVGQKTDTSQASSGASTTTTKGTQTGPYNPTNPAAGGFSSLGTALAGLYGAGAFGGKSYSAGNSGTGYTSLGAGGRDPGYAYSGG